MNEALHLAPGLLAVAESKGAEPEGNYWTFLTFAILVTITLLAVLTVAKNGYKDRVFKNPITSSAEQLFLFLENFALGIIGPHGRKYMPMLATFWLWIFIANMYGLFFPYTPTADLSSNIGLAVVAVLYVQWEGIKTNGPFGHLRHFAGPRLGGGLIFVSVMIFIIEIISEAMKMVSLSLRLYGNIHGGHEVVSRLNGLGDLHFGAAHVSVPIGAVLIPIKLLTVIVQALVFTLLFSVYLGLVTHHEEEDHSNDPARQAMDGEPHVFEPVHV